MAEQAKTELDEHAIVLGENNYNIALDRVIGAAKHELLIFDQDLSKGGYAGLKRFEQLHAFLAKDRHNRLLVILHDAVNFAHNCPRLCELLSTYGHSMTVYQTNDQAKVAKDMFVIADRTHYLRRFHVDHARFRFALHDPDTANTLYMRFEELLEASDYAISATQLGL